MKVNFLGQGLRPNSKKSVGNLIIDCLQNSDFHSFSCFVAFASKQAIQGLSDLILESKKHITNFNFFVGVDLKGTPKEALEEILLLQINSYIYYTNTKVIYHPKIYIFEGFTKCIIIIGSSNLTKSGLFSHIESSVVIKFKRKEKEGENLLKEIKDFYKDFLNDNSINVKKLNKKLIEDLVLFGIVLTETESKKIYSKNNSISKNVLKEISKLFPKIKLQKPSLQFGKKKSLKVSTTQKTKFNLKGKVLWRKENLPGSDVQYSPIGTNPTGCLRLTQARFSINGSVIDHTKYFRNNLFRNFKWIIIKQEPLVEIATIKFSIKIYDKIIGEYELEIRHKPSGESEQGNYTTSISWGELGSIIREKELRGRAINIYSPPTAQKEPFFMEIL